MKTALLELLYFLSRTKVAVLLQNTRQLIRCPPPPTRQLIRCPPLPHPCQFYAN